MRITSVVRMTGFPLKFLFPLVFVIHAMAPSIAEGQTPDDRFFGVLWGAGVHDVIASRGLSEENFSGALLREEFSTPLFHLPGVVYFRFERGQMLSGDIQDVGGLEAISVEVVANRGNCLVIADRWLSYFVARGVQFYEPFVGGLSNSAIQRNGFSESGTEIRIGYVTSGQDCELSLVLLAPDHTSAADNFESLIMRRD